MSTRPPCGPKPGEPVVAPYKTLAAILGGFATIGTGVAKAIELANPAIPYSAGGIGAIPLAAVGAAALVFVTTAYMLYERCVPKKGGKRCWAGAVGGITESFDSGWDIVFPSGAMHPRVDVVLKPQYWPLANDGAFFIACSPAPPGVGSPMIQTFFKSAEVCAAGAGAVVGAGVALVTAITVAVAIGAIGCSTIFFCLLALLVAAIVGAAIALGAAAAGGAIARAFAPDDTPESDKGAIGTGQLVSITGILLTMEEFDFANCGWWAQHATYHGDVITPGPYSDADAAQLKHDTCGVPDVPPVPAPGTGTQDGPIIH